MANSVKRRFDGFNLKGINCKIAIYDVASLRSLDGDRKVHKLLHGMSSYGTTHLNCSEVVASDVRSGDPDQYGNYSGLVGMAQRGVSKLRRSDLADSVAQEVDFAFTYMRLDCLDSETIGVLAPIYAAGVRIVSPSLNYSVSHNGTVLPSSSSDTFEPFLDTLALVDHASYGYLCAAILAVAMFISFDNFRDSYQLSFGKLVPKFITSVWNVFKLIVNQGKFHHQTTSSRSIWLLLTVGLFIIVCGLFLNLLRTEKVAQRSPDQIETTEDIIGTKFGQIEPKLITNGFTFALSKQVAKGSKEDRIFQRVLRNTENLISLTSTSSEAFTDPESNLISFIYVGLERKDSRETVLDGILIAPIRKNVQTGFKVYVQHRLKNMFELGLSGREFFDIFVAVAQVTGQWAMGRPNSTMCLLSMRDETDIPEMQFKLGHSRTVLKSLAALILLSAVVNLAEIVCKKRVKAKVQVDSKLGNQVAIVRRSHLKPARGGATGQNYIVELRL
ncbi:hypothetical protein HDE_11376 [Halotydeus destructor]|nr:hypothetical protein HDE_11376 [Halotydeus destructor]